MKEQLAEDEVDEYALLEEEPDPERLEEETIAFPPLPDDDAADDPAAEEAIKSAKQSANKALDRGDTNTALALYTEAIELGDASALLLAKRAELLLTLRCHVLLSATVQQLWR